MRNGYRTIELGEIKVNPNRTNMVPLKFNCSLVVQWHKAMGLGASKIGLCSEAADGIYFALPHAHKANHIQELAQVPSISEVVVPPCNKWQE